MNGGTEARSVMRPIIPTPIGATIRCGIKTVPLLEMNPRTQQTAALGCAAAEDLFLRFLHWVERAPHRLAISDGDEAWSYSALLGEVGRLGDLLPGATLGRPSLIAVLLPPGAPTVAGTLAALGRGHGVVCFEAGRPLEQRLGRLKAVRADYILTDRKLFEFLPLEPGCPVYLVEDARDTPIASWVPRRNKLFGLAFERGPLGSPRAHLITHRMMAAEIDQIVKETGLSQLDHLDMCFGSESEEFLPLVFRALVTGARLSFVPVSVRNPEARAEWARANEITHCTVTQDDWRDLCRGLKPGEKLGSIRFLEMRGERSHPLDIARIRQHLVPDALVWSSVAHPAAGSFLRAQCRAWQVSINRLLTMDPVVGKGVRLEVTEGPLDEAEVILHTDLRSPGLWLGSKKSGLEDAKSDVALKTGCIARMQEDGCIRFLGHREDYANILGKRVNLRQVERWIALQPGVLESAVITTEAENGSLELTAFVVPRPGGLATAEILRRAALRELFEVQRPMHWEELSALPKTFSGRLDRAVLEKLFRLQNTRTSSLRPDPMDWLRTVWERVLGHGNFGIHDTFFSVGGDPLTAAELAGTLSRKTGRRVRSDFFWEYSTIAELAVWMDAHAEDPVEVFPLLREAEPAGRAILIPPFGSSAALFQHLVPHMVLRHTVHCLDYARWPGLPDCASGETLGAHAAESILTQWPKATVSLIGFKGGARVAWETAQCLLQGGMRDVQLVLIGPGDEADTLEPIACPVVWIHRPRRRRFLWERAVRPAWMKSCRGRVREFAVGVKTADLLSPESAVGVSAALKLCLL